MSRKPIINLDEVEFHDWRKGDKYAGQMGELAEAVGGRKLGYNLTIVPAGKTAFPMHCHHAQEEMFLILEGEGELRLGESRWSLRAGDVIGCPTGGPETAHQIINTMTEGELKYLAVSTMEFPEICEYPDSGKILVRNFTEPEDTPTSDRGTELRKIFSAGEGDTPYWDDED